MLLVFFCSCVCYVNCIVIDCFYLPYQSTLLYNTSLLTVDNFDDIVSLEVTSIDTPILVTDIRPEQVLAPDICCQAHDTIIPLKNIESTFIEYTLLKPYYLE